jgi:hypothetical protein
MLVRPIVRVGRASCPDTMCATRDRRFARSEEAVMHAQAIGSWWRAAISATMLGGDRSCRCAPPPVCRPIGCGGQMMATRHSWSQVQIRTSWQQPTRPRWTLSKPSASPRGNRANRTRQRADVMGRGSAAMVAGAALFVDAARVLPRDEQDLHGVAVPSRTRAGDHHARRKTSGRSWGGTRRRCGPRWSASKASSNSRSSGVYSTTARRSRYQDLVRGDPAAAHGEQLGDGCARPRRRFLHRRRAGTGAAAGLGPHW